MERMEWREVRTMSEESRNGQFYTVSVYEPGDVPGVLAFTFSPKGLHRVSGEPPRRVPQYVVWVKQSGGGFSFDWGQTPDDPGPAKPALEHGAVERIHARSAWLQRVSELVTSVEQWSKELGWATRRIDKRLDDPFIGKHLVPALIMQDELCRVLLEPVGRSAPGADGVVDLYLMPAYDDIASLYDQGGTWHLRYLDPGDFETGARRDAAAVPLSKESLATVLAAMKEHAA
jgi:hypothetical protein